MPKAKVTGKPVRSHDNAQRLTDKALDKLGGKDLFSVAEAADDPVKQGLAFFRTDVDKG